MELKPDSLIIKNNMLNEMRGRMTLTEYRLFCVYLAKIDSRNPNSVRVCFPLSEYTHIMELDRPRREDLQEQAKSIVAKPIKIEKSDGGFGIYPLFQAFELEKINNEWIIKLTANSELEPYLFEQKKRFFKYKLYNTIRLGSYNQMRIYELLKQYEWLGKRKVELSELRAFMGIGENEYPVWNDFQQKILKVAQKAILKETDIYFEYKPIIKNRKTVAVEFTINKNEHFIDQLNLNDYILPPIENDVLEQNDGFTILNGETDDVYEQEESESKEIDSNVKNNLLYEALPPDFSFQDCNNIIEIARPIFSSKGFNYLPDDMGGYEIRLYHWLREVTGEVKRHPPKNKTNLYNYYVSTLKKWKF